VFLIEWVLYDKFLPNLIHFLCILHIVMLILILISGSTYLTQSHKSWSRQNPLVSPFSEFVLDAFPIGTRFYPLTLPNFVYLRTYSQR